MKVVRRIKDASELQLALDWAAKEGWNPGRHDSAPYYAAANTGYFVLEEDHKIIGTLAAVRYSDQYGFIGIFIIAPEHRQKGKGKMLFEAGMQALSECAWVGLNSVSQQIPYYTGFGFDKAWDNLRCSLQSPERRDTLHVDGATVYQEANLNALVEYDAHIFGLKREDFLKTLLQMPQTSCLVSSDMQGNIKGYGVIRACQIGYQIGPLYADDFETSKSIFEGLLSTVLGESISLDIPEVNQHSKNFIEYFNLTREEKNDTVAMYKSNSVAQPIASQLEKRYALGSREIGDGLPSSQGREKMGKRF